MINYNKSQDKITQYISMTFIFNKYTTWYYNITSSSKTRILSEDIYTEKHHIIPKSMGGGNEKSNIAVLSAREHFICHILLTKMTEGKHKAKMVYAAMMMRVMNSKNQKRYINARLYETVRKEYSKMIKGKRNPFYGKRHSEETLKKMRNRTPTKETLEKMRGRTCSEETLKKMSEAKKGEKNSFYGKTHTEKSRKKMSESLKGKNTGKDNGMYGKKHTEKTLEKMRGRTCSEETLKKMSEAAKNLPPMSKETKQKMSESGKKRKKTLCCEKWYDPGNLAKHRKAKH